MIIIKDVKILNISARYNLLFMALPFVIWVFMFAYVPIMGWSLAFFEYKPGIPLLECKFVGLEYFMLFLTDTLDMMRVVKNTMIFAVLIILITPIPMLFAILLNEVSSMKYKRIVQTLTTLPHFISWIIIYSLAFAIFSSDGVLNEVLMSWGIISKPTNVLGDAGAVYWFQTAIHIWKGVGWGAIVYLAAIVSIPREMYEAARIDGSNRFQSAWYITLPNLLNTYIVLLVLQIGRFINVGFEQYFVFNNPVTMRNIEVLDLYVYKIGLLNQDYSYSTAVGIIKSLISIAMVIGANKLAKRIRGNGII